MPDPIAASSIAAQAFRFLELAPISSFEDDSDKATDAADQYPIALNSCLSSCDWSFASTYVHLSEAIPAPEMAIDPALPWFYEVPGDLVKLREVGDRGTRWRLDKIGLRCNRRAPLPIRYTARIDNETALPETFQTAVALALAVLLAPRWLTTQSKVEGLEGKARATLEAAMREDSRMASEARYDGGEEQGDWVEEARW
jgi:hypothetical protein